MWDDRTNTVEAGIKSTFAGGRVNFNVAAYHSDYKDLQVPVAQPPLGFALIVNTSKAISKGIEFDLSARPTDNLALFAGGNYTKAELDASLVVNRITGETLPAGTLLPFAPEYSLSGGAEYEWPLNNGLGLYLNGNFAYTGEFDDTLGPAAGDGPFGDYTVFGLGAGLRADRWSLDLRVWNVTDEAETLADNNFDDFVIANLGSLPPGVTFNENFMLQPRTYRIALRYRF